MSKLTASFSLLFKNISLIFKAIVNVLFFQDKVLKMIFWMPNTIRGLPKVAFSLRPKPKPKMQKSFGLRPKTEAEAEGFK